VTPRERRPQIVDFDLRLLNTVLVAGAPRDVKAVSHGRVVVALTRVNGVGLAGFAKFLQ